MITDYAENLQRIAKIIAALDQKLTAMQWYADEVIAKYRG